MLNTEIEYPEKFEVTITTEDFINTNDYVSNDDCAMAKALKRIFPNTEINVGSTTANINKVEYNFDNPRITPSMSLISQRCNEINPEPLTLELTKNFEW